ncbi:MAG: hypothetical protein JNK69_12325 [Saprospiraceae bacterium]|nr:hypothetical protein [Candidatus Vicinibacter proximus]MBL7824185.1 hypothetical protein [Saprospiraceae bacterium]MCC6843820.1 hypothetical protein [Saprospiraceae bacterium]HRG31832.1 hypothetical protein [Saprospiraceae bacterium]
MTVRNQIRLIVYRMHEKGLEILLLQQNPTQNQVNFVEGQYHLDHHTLSQLDSIIQFQSEDPDGKNIHNVAIEGDYHDIPRIRSLISQDINKVKGKIKDLIPDLSSGVYLASKEAFKKVLPHEYAALKELKDIILDRNLVRNI